LLVLFVFFVVVVFVMVRSFLLTSMIRSIDLSEMMRWLVTRVIHRIMARLRLSLQTQIVHGRNGLTELPINVLYAAGILAKVHDDKVGGKEASGRTLFGLRVVVIAAAAAGAAAAAATVAIIIVAVGGVVVAPGCFRIRTFLRTNVLEGLAHGGVFKCLYQHRHGRGLITILSLIQSFPEAGSLIRADQDVEYGIAGRA
jgi:hypothetical protein